MWFATRQPQYDLSMERTADDDHAVVIRGIAAVVVAAAESGCSEDDLRIIVLAQMGRFGLRSRSDVWAIAQAIGMSPEPVDMDPEDLENHRVLYGLLGVPLPEDDLANVLRARQAVTQVAEEFETL